MGRSNSGRIAWPLILGILTVGCGEPTGALPAQTVELARSHGEDAERPSRAEIESADRSILFIGNSHAHPIPGLLAGIFERARPEERVVIARVPAYGFLADHADSRSTLEWIDCGPWKGVVLQAQKYSTSGRYQYPIDGALALADRARKGGAQVYLYPEWSRRGMAGEYDRIVAIHDRIADRSGAKVAPIGPAWERVQELAPRLDLYAADGNHASPAGSYLVACVFYSLLTGEPVPSIGVGDSSPPLISRANANRLQQAAWEVVHEKREDSREGEGAKDAPIKGKGKAGM